jgi:DNA-binding transcriptional MerR regulator
VQTVDESQPCQGWRIGEIAATTGLTVRTLHYYDQIGLLVPSLRTRSGHRRYTQIDVKRLYEIVALRGFGFPIEEIAGLLDDERIDPLALVNWQLEQVMNQLTQAARLRDRLYTLRDQLEQVDEPSANTLITMIQEMTTMNEDYVPETLEELAEGRRRMSDLTPEQVDALSERRTASLEALSAQQRADLEERRRSRLGDIGQDQD